MNACISSNYKAALKAAFMNYVLVMDAKVIIFLFLVEFHAKMFFFGQNPLVFPPQFHALNDESFIFCIVSVHMCRWNFNDERLLIESICLRGFFSLGRQVRLQYHYILIQMFYLSRPHSRCDYQTFQIFRMCIFPNEILLSSFLIHNREWKDLGNHIHT